MNTPTIPSSRPDTQSALSSDDISRQVENLLADLMKLAPKVTDDVSDGIGKAGRQIGQAATGGADHHDQRGPWSFR